MAGVGSAKVPPMNGLRRASSRISTALALIIVGALAAAPAAMAADGVGVGGRTTDKSVTFFCFGVIALFMILPIVLSLIQARLDNRKERMREQLDRVHRP
jgi:hypothetical protein